MKQKRAIILMLIGGIILTGTWNACYYDVEEELYPMMECDTTAVSYTSDILPILQNICGECHLNGNNEGGVILDPHESLKVWAESGRLVGAINHQAGFFPMPKDKPMLDDCSIQRIEAWVNAGAPEN